MRVPLKRPLTDTLFAPTGCGGDESASFDTKG